MTFTSAGDTAAAVPVGDFAAVPERATRGRDISPLPADWIDMAGSQGQAMAMIEAIPPA